MSKMEYISLGIYQCLYRGRLAIPNVKNDVIQGDRVTRQ